jgi:hypothetical protein
MQINSVTHSKLIYVEIRVREQLFLILENIPLWLCFLFCFVEEDYARAMQLLFEVLQIDRQYQQGEAHQALMTLFAMLGDGHELVKEYRVKLQKMAH